MLPKNVTNWLYQIPSFLKMEKLRPLEEEGLAKEEGTELEIELRLPTFQSIYPFQHNDPLPYPALNCPFEYLLISIVSLIIYLQYLIFFPLCCNAIINFYK